MLYARAQRGNLLTIFAYVTLIFKINRVCTTFTLYFVSFKVLVKIGKISCAKENRTFSAL